MLGGEGGNGEPRERQVALPQVISEFVWFPSCVLVKVQPLERNAVRAWCGDVDFMAQKLPAWPFARMAV
jgi:hypothetical protein